MSNVQYVFLIYVRYESYLLVESLKDVENPVYIISHVMNIKAGVPTLTITKENGISRIE